MKTKSTLNLRDSRWLRGIDSFALNNSDEAVTAVTPNEPQLDEDEEELIFLDDNTFTCTTCNISLDVEDRSEISAHYGSEWHKHNVYRISHGKDSLTEDQFEDVVDQDDNFSPQSSDEDEEDYFGDLIGSSHAYFIQDDEVCCFCSLDSKVFSIYKCILPPGEGISPAVFTTPINCAILMMAGGHFAGAVFRNNVMTHHKAIHRYTVRAKQGGSQSANDSKGGPAHSAGAALRRYNERTLRAEISELLLDWAAPLAGAPLIFLRCSTANRSVFVKEGGFVKTDKRLRTLPFQTRRPAIQEIKRAHELLESVFSHGPLNVFKAELKEKRQRQQGMRKAAQRLTKITRRLSIVESEEDEKREIEQQQKKKERSERKRLEMQYERAEREALDPFAEIDKQWRLKLYASIRNNDPSLFTALLNEAPCDEDVIKTFIEEATFPPDGNTLLHIASKNGHVKSVELLLERGYGCSTKNEKGEVPFDVAADKPTRLAFMNHRAKLSEIEKNVDWRSTHIPMPTAKVEKDEAQLEKEREKRKLKKEKQKEKQRTKKAEEAAQAAEEKARAEWLGLSDRERRARAAEARLARLEQNDGPRCYQCGGPIKGTPFNYENFEFCAPACVAGHRQGQPALKCI